MTSRLWFVSAIGSALFAAVLIQVPQWIHQQDARYQGIPVHLNADEYVYLARVEEALTGRPEQTGDAFIGDASLKGTQPALVERVIGTVFAPTGWRAATVLQVLDSLVVFLFVLTLFGFFHVCGFSGGLALLGAVLVSLIEFNTLNRPVHPAPSFLLVFLTLFCIAKGYGGRPLFSVIGGILLGLLFGDYFWSWTFAWAWIALLILWEIAEWYRTRSSTSLTHLQWLGLSCAVGAVVTIPFLIPFAEMFHHPSYADAAFRSGLHPSRVPESWIYSILFATMTGGVLLSLYQNYERLRPYRFAIVTLLTGFVVMHQEFVHGIVFNFVSHYLLALAVAAMCCFLLAVRFRTPALVVTGLAASLYLAALAYDGRWVLKQFQPQPANFAEQHFSTLLPVLHALPRTTILSDPESLAFIAGATHHDVPYSVYLKNVLIPHTEIAERFCLTQLPVEPANRLIEKREWLIYPDAVSAYRNEAWVRQKELEMVGNACLRADRKPAEFLSTYGISYVLWDEEKHPEWKLKRLQVPLERVSSGSGWSLWKVSSN